MSYCRWSCMDFWSDIYCYENFDGGIAIHVAAFRIEGEIPKKPPFTKENIDNGSWIKAHKEQMAALDTAVRTPIGLPYDGESFYVDSYSQALENLLKLKSLGYHVPDVSITQLIKDAENARE